MFTRPAAFRLPDRPPNFAALTRRGWPSCQAVLLVALWGLMVMPVKAQMPNDANPVNGGQESLNAKDAGSQRNAVIGPLDDKRLIAVGDKLSFQIAEEPGQKSLVTVTSSGEADFPYVGRVKMVDRTCKQVAGDLKRLLEKSFYRKATVGLALEVASTLPLGTYFVTGQVIKQGSQEIPRDHEVRVSEAILAAGGFADFADKRRVRVIRPHPGGNERFTVDVKAVLERGEVTKDIVVRPGDYIVVPERMFNF